MEADLWKLVGTNETWQRHTREISVDSLMALVNQLQNEPLELDKIKASTTLGVDGIDPIRLRLRVINSAHLRAPEGLASVRELMLSLQWFLPNVVGADSRTGMPSMPESLVNYGGFSKLQWVASGGPPSQEDVISVLKTGTARSKCHAAVELARRKLTETVPALIEALGDPGIAESHSDSQGGWGSLRIRYFRVREEAAYALFKVNPQEMPAALATMESLAGEIEVEIEYGEPQSFVEFPDEMWLAARR